MTPRKSKTFSQICKLPRDNISTTSHWMTFDEKIVCLAAQELGKASTEKITLPRKTFEKFIDWYNGVKR